jgi:cob(I)alamin adenosyltransferase
MATRNHPGGLAKATKDAARVLDASGKDVVIVETVGAGQSEVEVVEVAHTVMVVLAPGLGDDIQAIKAGQMEIGDIFVVNKADRENANKAMSDIEVMLEMGTSEKKGWKPLVVKTSALTGEGIAELLERIEEHRKYLKTGVIDERRKERIENELVEALTQKITESIVEELKQKGEWNKLTQKILSRETDPYSAADKLLAKQLKTTRKRWQLLEVKTLAGQRLEKGLVQVYTGEGKGKTSAAFGLALRAVGRGLRVYIIQFIKGGFDYGELHIVDKIPNLKLATFGRGKFITEVPPSEEDSKLALEALKFAERVVDSGQYDVVVLDEVNVALNLKMIRIEEVIDMIKNKPKHVELVLTGRNAPTQIIDVADLVTEMREVKHPYAQGVPPRKGIEY